MPIKDALAGQKMPGCSWRIVSDVDRAQAPVGVHRLDECDGVRLAFARLECVEGESDRQIGSPNVCHLFRRAEVAPTDGFQAQHQTGLLCLPSGPDGAFEERTHQMGIAYVVPQTVPGQRLGIEVSGNFQQPSKTALGLCSHPWKDDHRSK